MVIVAVCVSVFVVPLVTFTKLPNALAVLTKVKTGLQNDLCLLILSNVMSCCYFRVIFISSIGKLRGYRVEFRNIFAIMKSGD